MGKTTKKMTLSAMFLAIGMVLPFLTGQIPEVGNMMLPMHIPVLLCGLICGWQYGAVLGFVLPLLRYLIFGMPVLFPTGTAMTFELMTYGDRADLFVFTVEMHHFPLQGIDRCNDSGTDCVGSSADDPARSVGRRFYNENIPCRGIL